MIVGLSVGLIVMAFNNPSGNPPTGTGAVISVGYGAPANSIYIASSTGYVGIGTTGPNYKLDVSGDINITGSYRVNGTSIPTSGFINRGDPADYDYTLAKGNLTADGNWHNLDLSGIVPAGAKAVLLRVFITGNAVNQTMTIRTNGNTGYANTVDLRTQVANQILKTTEIIAPDTNRIIQYASNATNVLGVTVAGWWF